jgi:uncharacterized membrane protein
MKVLGHPIHLMLIHFPSALLPMELICYGLFFFSGKASFGDASFYSMAGAVGFGWMAVITGSFDLIALAGERSEILIKALVHGGINATVLIFYTLFLYVLYVKYPAFPVASFVMLILKLFLVIFMVVGNYLGASLVLKYGVGTQKGIKSRGN